MALLFMDGFDHYATADFLKKWTSWQGAGAITGGAYESGNDERWAQKTLSSNYATLIIGGRFYPANNVANWSGRGFIEVYDGSTLQVYVRREADASVRIMRGDGTQLGTSAANVLPAGAYSHCELKVTIDDAAGSFDFRIGGVSVMSGSSIDTKNSANAYANAVRITSASNTGNCYLDDFYICDTSGSVANDFLGEVRVKTIRPTTEGTNSAWTPLSGTDNALMVDETSQDGDTTYVYSDTINARDTYVIADMPATGGAIYGVAVNVMARKEGDVSRKIKPVVKSGATYSLGSEVTLSTAYTNTQQVYTTDPNTSTAWTESTVNAMEAGVDLTV